MNTQRPQLDSLDHLVLTVEDLRKTLDFYCGILGCREVTFGAGRKAIRLGRQKINLHLKGREVAPHARRPTEGSADLCFLSETPIEDWIKHLHAKGVPIELGPVPRTGAEHALCSIYIRDPDGNLIEIANAE